MNKYNRKIIDTKHSIERFVDRYQNLYDIFEVREVINRAINTIVDDYDDKSAVYAVWSKSTNITVIIDWRADTKAFSNTNHAIIVTLPPPKRSLSDLKTTSVKDVKIMVERFLSKEVKSSLKEKSHEYIKKDSSLGIEVFIESGKIYDFGIDNYFIID